MKNSGIEWIGEIPVGWSIMPHKYIIHKEKSICEHYNGENIISLTMNGVVIRDLTAGGKMPTTFDGYQYVEPNDLLLCLFDIDVTPRCVGIVKNNGITSPAYSRFKVHKGFYNAYYDYLLRFIDDEKVFIHLSKNLRSSLTETDFGAILSIVPPFEEQQKIASFLDQKCAEIDAVIEKTKATIEEYKKLKQSVITEAVTKGIRGNQPMKDSGIEWIGEIPVGWETYRFKNIFSFGKGLPITKENLTETGLSVISYGQIHSKTNTGTNIGQDLIRFVSEEYLQTNKSSLVDKDDFIFADTSEDLDGCGNCVYVDKTMTLFAGYHTIVAFSNRENDNKYLAYLFKSDEWRSQIRSRVSGVKLFSISKKILANTTLILPPLKEEKEISDYLDQKCAEIDTLIAKKTTLLTELETYKKSLIYEYVTGKKEVGEDNVSTQVAVYSPYFPVIIKVNNLYNALKAFMFGILDKCNYDTGRVKLEKMMFVAQHSIGFDLGNEYSRAELGPLDSLFYQCEYDLVKDGCIIKDKKRNIRRIYYKPGRNNHKYKEEYNRYFADCDTEIDRIINIFKDYDVQKSERIATLFGAWNDAIIDKRQFTDEDIVEDVRNNWHEHKKEYEREEWLEDLEEMKKFNLIPKGYGKKTAIKND